MRLFQSKCESCGDLSYVFPDQIQKIKQNSNLKLHPYVKGDMAVGDEWFCIKCDASKKDGSRCKIYSEIPSEKAGKLIKIRQRETTLKSNGFILPKMY